MTGGSPQRSTAPADLAVFERGVDCFAVAFASGDFLAPSRT